MADNKYTLGSTIRLTARFELVSVLTDPTAVTLLITPPSGGSFYATPIVNTGTGLYRYDYIPPIVGTYKYRFFGTGAVVAETEKLFAIEYA